MALPVLIADALVQVGETGKALAGAKRRPPAEAVTALGKLVALLHAALAEAVNVRAELLQPRPEDLAVAVNEARAALPAPTKRVASTSPPGKRHLRVVKPGERPKGAPRDPPLPTTAQVVAMLDRVMFIDPGNTAGKGGAHVGLEDLAKDWLTEERRYRALLRRCERWELLAQRTPERILATGKGIDAEYKAKREMERELERQRRTIRAEAERRAESLWQASKTPYSSTRLYSEFDCALPESNRDLGGCPFCMALPGGKHLRGCKAVVERELAAVKEKLEQKAGLPGPGTSGDSLSPEPGAAPMNKTRQGRRAQETA